MGNEREAGKLPYRAPRLIAHGRIEPTYQIGSPPPPPTPFEDDPLYPPGDDDDDP